MKSIVSKVRFDTKVIAAAASERAPDGSTVTPLLRVKGGGMARFELPAGQTTRAVKHRTVEELWLFVAGAGELWRKAEGQEEIIAVGPGVCISLPLGTSFQLRAHANEALVAVGVTMPPWPGDGEAVAVQGPWKATVP